MLSISRINAGYILRFPYSPSLVEQVRSIEGRRYIPADKTWFIPETQEVALTSIANYYGISMPARTYQVNFDDLEPLPELTIDIPLKRQPFEYQKRGIAYAIKHKRVIVGDEPGLGKTGQSIGACIGAGRKCILVICPATLKENWKREWELWSDYKPMVISDKTKKTWSTYYKVGMVNVFIVNYESLKKYFVASISTPEGKKLRLNHIHFVPEISLFDAIIIDEVHRCKDGKTQQAKFCMGICKEKEFVLALTGTPVVNKPLDLISQLYIINKLEMFGGYKGFINRYCQGQREASNLQELNYYLRKNCFYRRQKSEVLKDLPDKARSIIKCEITTRAEYIKAERDLEAYLRENLKKTEGQITTALRGEVMVLLGILKKISARGKILDVVEHVNSVVESGEKIVVFAWHKEIVRDLQQHIPGAVTIVGDNTMEERQHAVDSFQKDPSVQVIICNIKSGGVGITLTASSRVAFIELPWHAADADQCEDRCHRIGQKDSVQCTYFNGDRTVDEYIYSIIEAKRNVANQVTGSENNVETSMVDQIINFFNNQNTN